MRVKKMTRKVGEMQFHIHPEAIIDMIAKQTDKEDESK